jgi:hypothetical protein
MLTLDISMSLDGLVAGPDQTLEKPLGEGGDRLHEWAFPVAGFRERHGLSGGETASTRSPRARRRGPDEGQPARAAAPRPCKVRNSLETYFAGVSAAMGHSG